MRGIFEGEDFDRWRPDGGNKSTVNQPLDEPRVAIFAASSTPVRGGTMFPSCAFSGNACFRRRRRKLRYATDKFIAALCAIPDRTPSGADRRHCRGQPAFGGRIDRSTRRPSDGSGSPQASDVLEVASSTAKADWFIPH
jgi:hypothetical protein